MTRNRFTTLKLRKQGRITAIFLILFVAIGACGFAQDSIFGPPSGELQRISFELSCDQEANDALSFDLRRLPMEAAETVDLVGEISVNSGLAGNIAVEQSFLEPGYEGMDSAVVGLKPCEILPLDPRSSCGAACENCCKSQESCELNTNSGSRDWIIWRNEQCASDAGPVCCSIQERTVNWRLSSMFLQGCMPSGYSLQRFIESVQNIEHHSDVLSSSGPSDVGGSFEDAVAIEGAKTKSIQELSIDITPPEGELPPDHAKSKFDDLPELVHSPGTHRSWNGTSVYWQASLLNHQPLYFEDVNLERHGFSHGCWQPFISGGLFFSRLPVLPYYMAAQPPYETQFTLGETRPGNHACYVCERPPVRFDATLVEAAVVTGLVFLIP